MTLILSIIFKPLVFLAFITPGYLLAWWLHKKIPEGRLKRILYRPIRSFQKPRFYDRASYTSPQQTTVGEGEKPAHLLK